MHEAGVVERRRRLEARDMAAEFGGFLVGAQHDRRRVPPDEAPDRLFEFADAGMLRLIFGADRVDIGAYWPRTAVWRPCGGPRSRRRRAVRRRAPAPRRPRPSRAHRAIRASPRRRPWGRRSWSLPMPCARRFRQLSPDAYVSWSLSIGNADPGGPLMHETHNKTPRPGVAPYQRRRLSAKCGWNG